MTERKNLFVPGKMAYIKGEKRPDVDCILCAVTRGDDDVECLVVGRSGGFVVSANLYPYNPGHILIFPERHIVDPADLSAAEILEMHRLEVVSRRMLESLYGARGFNVGCNIGAASGASIGHFHLHVVPRYERELGFVDIVGGARIIVEDPNVTCSRLRAAFGRFIRCCRNEVFQGRAHEAPAAGSAAGTVQGNEV